MDTEIISKQQLLETIRVLKKLEDADIFIDDRECGALRITRANLGDLLTYGSSIWNLYQKHGDAWRDYSD